MREIKLSDMHSVVQEFDDFSARKYAFDCFLADAKLYSSNHDLYNFRLGVEMKRSNLCLAMFSLLICAALGFGKVADSVEKYNAAEARIIAEEHAKLLVAKKLLATELTNDRANAMKANDLKEANLADDALTKVNKEIAELTGGDNSGPAAATPTSGKVLLIFQDPQERDCAVECCKKYSLQYETKNDFDTTQTDYSAYATIISGSNNLKPWAPALKSDPAASRPLHEFVANGGHLIAFGSWGGQAVSPLKDFGIENGSSGCKHFAPAPGRTKLLVQGNEDIVPKNHELVCTGSVICSVPCDTLLLRSDEHGVAQTGPNARAMITLACGKGRVTFSPVEPVNGDGMWLLKATLSWISRGCPTR